MLSTNSGKKNRKASDQSSLSNKTTSDGFIFAKRLKKGS